jgi:hypothetical protein
VTVALKHDRTDPFCETDGVRHRRHKFDLKTPNDHMIDTVLGGYKIAEGIFDKPGKLQVNYTTPTNYTISGLDPYP